MIESVPPWYSPIKPKPEYQNDRAIALWDVPLFAESTEVRSNRIDARIEDKKEKRVILLEMSCPWLENREEKQAEKTAKYAPLRWELRKRYPDYEVKQYNIIIDVLGGYSQELFDAVKELLGVKKAKDVLLRMQKSIICGSLHIARTFKIQTS